MTDRPTPEEIILLLDTTIHPGSPRAISEFVAHAEVPDIIPALRNHGYVIVHPDDVPADPPGSEHINPGDADRDFGFYAAGWNACRALIFGDTP